MAVKDVGQGRQFARRKQGAYTQTTNTNYQHKLPRVGGGHPTEERIVLRARWWATKNLLSFIITSGIWPDLSCYQNKQTKSLVAKENVHLRPSPNGRSMSAQHSRWLSHHRNCFYIINKAKSSSQCIAPRQQKAVFGTDRRWSLTRKERKADLYLDNEAIRTILFIKVRGISSTLFAPRAILGHTAVRILSDYGRDPKRRRDTVRMEPPPHTGADRPALDLFSRLSIRPLKRSGRELPRASVESPNCSSLHVAIPQLSSRTLRAGSAKRSRREKGVGGDDDGDDTFSIKAAVVSGSADRSRHLVPSPVVSPWTRRKARPTIDRWIQSPLLWQWRTGDHRQEVAKKERGLLGRAVPVKTSSSICTSEEASRRGLENTVTDFAVGPATSLHMMRDGSLITNKNPSWPAGLS
jgi:hypothetical protein